MVGDNTDKGVLFALTCINRLNGNIIIDKQELNTTKFFAEKELGNQSSTYSIKIKNILLEVLDRTSNGGILV